VDVELLEQQHHQIAATWMKDLSDMGTAHQNLADLACILNLRKIRSVAGFSTFLSFLLSNIIYREERQFF
jgi:hypothetical protein